MSIENGKQPAFPNSSLETAFGSTGLSKREWFAGMALQGLLASRDNVDYEKYTFQSLEYADQMIERIEETTPKELPIDMLKAIVDHSNEPAMDDGQFRKFVRGNAQYVIDSQKGGVNG